MLQIILYEKAIYIYFLFHLYFGFTQNNNLLKSELNFKIDSLFKSSDPGGSILIKKGKNVIFKKNFGVEDIVTQKSFTEKTISNTGSISKTFVAYAIYKLHEQKLLNINDQITKYFKFKNENIVKEVTIKHLLNHTSGIPDSRKVFTDSIFYLSAKDAENFAPLLEVEKLNFIPNEKWQYSNPCYNGLALIIEKITGNKWQNFVSEKIFKPLKMKSLITDGDFPRSGVAHAYFNEKGKYIEADYGEIPTFAAAGNGGVWCSIDDLEKYVTKVWKDESLLNKDLMKSLKKSTLLNNNENSGHSSIWFCHKGISRKSVDKNYETIEHSGSQGGFVAHIVMIPEKEITIIWLTNNNEFISPIIEKTLIKCGYIN